MLIAGAGMALFSRMPAGDRIGLIRVEGPITDSTDTIQTLEDYGKDSSVKAIVLRVDSPGGAVAPSQEIFEELKKVAAKKKIVVSMGSLAASGGYYISVPAAWIVANPGTITGSIGVIMEIPNFKGLMDKIGVKAEVIKSGKNKDIASSFRKMTPEEREILQGLLDKVHEQFINAVSEGRKMPVEKVRAIADGRVFSGQQAKQIGLVDQLGDLQDAIKAAKDLAGIKGEAQVIKKKPRRGIFELLKQKISIPDTSPSFKLSYTFSP